MRTILITNDDGVYGIGLRPLIKELKKIAKVIVVVPDRERSATSHMITLSRPLRMHKIDREMHVLDGTPADCVRFGAIYLAKHKIDLVVSGINAGSNMGEDIFYSGTVAGAREAALLGIPSFAISVSDVFKCDFNKTSVVAKSIAKKLIRKKMINGVYLNVNVPPKTKGYKITTLGKRIYDENIEKRKDPKKYEYYWMGGRSVSGVDRRGTDIYAVKRSFVSITPLKTNPSALDKIEELNKWIRNSN